MYRSVSAIGSSSNMVFPYAIKLEPVKEGFYMKTPVEKFYMEKAPPRRTPINNIKSCSATGACSKLDPVLEPKYNLKEVIKQFILLEDHLSHAKKRCLDCIRNHSYYIEGLLEEAITLDNKRVDVNLTNEILSTFLVYKSKLFRGPSSDAEYHGISQGIRVLRKKLMNNPEICNFGI